MKIELKNLKLNQIKADLELVFVINKNLKNKWVDVKDFNMKEYAGERDQILININQKKIYIGVESMEQENLRIGAGIVAKTLAQFKFKTIKAGLYGDSGKNAQAIAEGFLLGSYNFQKYKSKKLIYPIAKIIFSTEEYSDLKINGKLISKSLKEAEVISKAVDFVRDIINIAPSEMHPVKLAEISKSIAKENNLQIKVYGEKYIEKEGMGAFLAVSKASAYPPQLIHLIYKGKNTKKRIALVGKGLTYDTGGLSLKPSDSMVNMKSDESGASAILGIMEIAKKLNLPIEIHGIIGATENSIGKNAYKPDDVLTAMNGKTIEIKNTDAEGRLVLADCLVYAQKFKPDFIIDLATLTGACIVALGEYTIGLMGFNEDLKNKLLKAGLNSGELISVLPFNRYLSEDLKSEVADISNISSSRYGGAITAALFLGEFITKENKNKWVHLDIAGPSFAKKPWAYNSYGGTGAGIRLIVEWMKNLL